MFFFFLFFQRNSLSKNEKKAKIFKQCTKHYIECKQKIKLKYSSTQNFSPLQPISVKLLRCLIINSCKLLYICIYQWRFQLPSLYTKYVKINAHIPSSTFSSSSSFLFFFFFFEFEMFIFIYWILFLLGFPANLGFCIIMVFFFPRFQLFH